MKIRPYLTFNGECREALELYQRAFHTEVSKIMYFRDIPPNPDYPIPAKYAERVLQATLTIGDDFIRMSDCGPGTSLNDVSSERVSLSVEIGIEETKTAFDALAKEGRIGMPLEQTFYSPCAGVVFDKFGVMWNFSAQNETA